MSTKHDNRTIQPYLFFNGSCEEAVEFYRKALGAEVEMMMRFKDSPEPPQPGLAGFFILEARDLNHAIQLMSNHPVVKGGPVEIRPIADEAEMDRKIEQWRSTTRETG